MSLCHAPGSLLESDPLKGKAHPNCYFAVNNIRVVQLALGIAAGMPRTSCGRSLPNIEGWMGYPTSCSKIFLTEHGRKLCLKRNSNVANSILG